MTSCDYPSACLQVLNLGHNALKGQLKLAGLPSLRALMLNDNQLTGVEGNVNTLARSAPSNPADQVI